MAERWAGVGQDGLPAQAMLAPRCDALEPPNIATLYSMPWSRPHAIHPRGEHGGQGRDSVGAE